MTRGGIAVVAQPPQAIDNAAKAEVIGDADPGSCAALHFQAGHRRAPVPSGVAGVSAGTLP